MKPYFHKDAKILANHFENLVREWRSTAFKQENEKSSVGIIQSSVEELNRDINNFRNELNKIRTNEDTAKQLL